MYLISLVMGNKIKKNVRMIEWKKIFRYSFIESKHPTGPLKVLTGEPLFENLCSYEAVENVYHKKIFIY